MARFFSSTIGFATGMPFRDKIRLSVTKIRDKDSFSRQNTWQGNVFVPNAIATT
jgi:hypothetical protein